MFVVAALLLIDSVAFAHKVMIFAYVDGDTVYTESKFSGGKKAVNSTVAVYDQQDNLLLEGKTDENGEFFFKVPQKTTLNIVLNAGMGHRAEWTVPVEEIKEINAQSIADVKSKHVSGKPENLKFKTDSTVLLPATGFTSLELQEVVEKALEKKLRPVMRVLSESREKGPSLNEILGGIGYIFGLLGVAAYFHYRKK